VAAASSTQAWNETSTADCTLGSMKDLAKQAENAMSTTMSSSVMLVIAR